MIYNLCIPPTNSQYKVLSPFLFPIDRFQGRWKDDIIRVYGFKIDQDKVEIPAGIIFTFKCWLSGVKDRAELIAYKKYNPGLEPFYLWGRTEDFQNIQLESQ